MVERLPSIDKVPGLSPSQRKERKRGKKDGKDVNVRGGGGKERKRKKSNVKFSLNKLVI